MPCPSCLITRAPDISGGSLVLRTLTGKLGNRLATMACAASTGAPIRNFHEFVSQGFWTLGTEMPATELAWAPAGRSNTVGPLKSLVSVSSKSASA